MAFTPFVLPATPFHRMRLAATLLLVVMAGVFVAALWGQAAYPHVVALGYVRALAEASLVGGLADWFAVTALFRHPLGLPIPHTAIIPTNKDRIGDALAAFLKDNFLTPAVMARRMEGFHVAAALSRWLVSSAEPGPGGPTGRLRRALSGLFARFVGALDDATVAQLLAVTVTDQLRTMAVAPVVGRFLGSLVADGRHEALVERAVAAGLDLLDAHEGEIHAAVAERSGKWVPAFVDEKIAGGIINAVRTRLLAMSEVATAVARRDQVQVMADFRERARALETARTPLPPPAAVATALGREHPDRAAITAWLTRLASDLQDADTPGRTAVRGGQARPARFAGHRRAVRQPVGHDQGVPRRAARAGGQPAHGDDVALRRRARRGHRAQPGARRCARYAGQAGGGQRRGDLWLEHRPAGQRHDPVVGRGDRHRSARGGGRARPPVYPHQRHRHRRAGRAGDPRGRAGGLAAPRSSTSWRTISRRGRARGCCIRRARGDDGAAGRAASPTPNRRPAERRPGG